MPRKYLVILAGLTSLALALSAVATAQKKKPKDPPGQQGGNSLRIAANPNPLVFGGSTTVSGELRGPNEGGKRVTLEHNPYPFTGGYRDVATTTTPSNGRYSFTTRPGVNTRYRTTANVSPRVTSPELLVQVRIRVGVRASDRTPSRGSRVRFSGSAFPAHDGHLVLIKRRTRSGSFRTVARTRLLDAGTARSRYARRVRVFRSGTYRVSVAGHGDHISGLSSTRTLIVR
jgi:hypothetical protein